MKIYDIKIPDSVKNYTINMPKNIWETTIYLQTLADRVYGVINHNYIMLSSAIASLVKYISINHDVKFISTVTASLRKYISILHNTIMTSTVSASLQKFVIPSTNNMIISSSVTASLVMKRKFNDLNGITFTDLNGWTLDDFTKITL